MHITEKTLAYLKSPSIRSYLLLYAVIAILLSTALVHMPVTVDYKLYISNTRSFLDGDTRLYDSTPNSFYYLPWSLLITVPLSFLPDHWGQAGLCFLSAGGIFLSLHLLVKQVSGWGIMLVAFNLYTINMIASGQWDGICVGACGLAWWSAKNRHLPVFGLMILLLTTKPTNTLIALTLLVIYVARHWSLRDLIEAASLPVLGVGASFLACGLDWPLRYLQYIQSAPPPQAYNLSLWSHLSLLVFPVLASLIVFLLILKKDGIGADTLALGMTTNLIISPYVLSYHFVGASPSLAWLAKHYPLYALIPWLLMVYQLVNITRSSTPNYFLYPLCLALASILLWIRGQRNQQQPGIIATT